MRIAGIAVVVTLLTSLSIITFLTPAAEYLPEGKEAKAFSALSAPAGYSLTEMKVIGEDLNNELALHINAEPDAYLAGKTDIPPLSSVVSSVSAQRVFTIIETVNPAHIDALRDALRKRFKDYPGMRGFSARGSIISGNNGGTRSVNLDIKGNDLRDLYQTGLSVMQRVEEVFDNPEVNSTPSSLVLAQPLIELRPDWNRAAELGLSAEELGYSIAALTDGAYVGKYLLDDNRVDMCLFSDNGTEQSLDNLSDLPLFVPSYGVVPLSDVVALEAISLSHLYTPELARHAPDFYADL